MSENINPTLGYVKSLLVRYGRHIGEEGCQTAFHPMNPCTCGLSEHLAALEREAAAALAVPRQPKKQDQDLCLPVGHGSKGENVHSEPDAPISVEAPATKRTFQPTEHQAFVAVMNALDVHMPPDGAKLLKELREIAATVGYPWKG